MGASDPMRRKKLTWLDWVLVCSIVVLLLLTVIPRLPSISFGERPIADLYNPVSNELAGILMKIDPEHHFQNGRTCEGWLVRGVNGMDVWFPADQFTKARRVNR